MNMSTRKVGAVACSAAVLLVLVWYAALFRPQSSRLTAAHQAYAAAEQQMTQLRTQVASLQVLERQAPADKAKLAVLQHDVPSSPDLKDVLDQLHSLATGTGCELTTVVPSVQHPSAGAAPTGAAAKTLTLGMTATGTYPQLMSFLTGLAGMTRTVVVDTVTLSPGTGGQMSMTLSSRIFYT